MFQFRRFPTYAYLIQRTLTRYCRAGFPHSEIHGYSGYLLLPVAYRSLSRPSSAPDAKAFPLRPFQLDLSSKKLAPFRFRFAKTPYPLLPSPPPSQTRSRWALSRLWGRKTRRSVLPRLVREMVLSRIMQASQRSSRNCNCYPAPFRTLFHNYFCHTLVWRLSVALLITCVALFSFQGALSSSFEARSKHLIPIKCFDLISMVEIVGFEPATSCLQGRRSPS